MPYYVSPEQMMQDKAEYAKKGIAKGRSIIAMEYVNGILLGGGEPERKSAQNFEIYDNIAFAGAGKYSELKICKAGSGMRTSRASCIAEDVTAGQRLFQSLGTIFSQEMKPLEVEILVVQIGHNGHTKCTAFPSTAASSMRSSLPSSVENPRLCRPRSRKGASPAA